ncbi:polyphosphate kinase 2 family protein [Janibacter melonis]|uniref:polyphosphate kinase 2 family protein n=1 Tax=Janibacter melonis TaxID=262209 RepID=UPI00178357B1|nr:polyphosphate kinase 2 family protein [Janibacter melonis]
MAKGSKKTKTSAKSAKDERSKDKRPKGADRKGAGPKKPAADEPVQTTVPKGAPVPQTFGEALRAGPTTRVDEIDTRGTPGFDGDKAAAAELMPELMPELADVVSELQERLYAESKGGGQRSVLLVIQGMDTSGKGGIMRHVVGAMDPQGVALTSFKVPSDEERRHPFLWRIRRALPRPGEIGVFDRSHYEDVLVVRVHDLVPRAQWSRRYGQIATFERGLVESGTTVVKVMLHISKDEQRARLAERLARPDKHWKYNPGDIDEREHWDEYMEAYQSVLERTSTESAPWYVVPADRKWYARLAVMQLLKEHLEAMDPRWPAADFDVEVEQERLEHT